MNEEPKPSATSSGFIRADDNQDERQSLATDQEFSAFLMRRQLLSLESKRIRELRLEAEAELKNKQNNIVIIRDRVLAALGDHLAHQEELARIESLRSQRQNSLPRKVERYIRRRGKKLFTRQKPGASTRIADELDAIGEQNCAWLLPKVRRLDAWNAWFAENDLSAPDASCFRKDRIQVALVVSGGIGDLLKSTHLVRAVSDRFSCDLTIIAAQPLAGEVVARNPYVRAALVPTTQHVYNLADHLRHIPVFDLVVVWRYHVQYTMPLGSRLPRGDIESIKSKSSALKSTIEKYCILHGWHNLNFAFSREMTRLGLSAMKVSVATSGLPHPDLDDIPFFPANKSLRVIAPLLRRPYVTVHHGFDLLFLPARTRNTEYSSTKNISTQQWRQIISAIRKEGVDVIQLGIAEEEKLEGVTHYLNGQTSLEETGLLIKHGLCHIDTEGGLVHLANAVHTRCVVLFGPTPVEFFGYPQNINLEPSGCKACWFATQNWLIECPRHTSGPDCMIGHSADSVADAANGIIAESEKPSATLIVAETRSSPRPLAETIATARTFFRREAANRVLLILEDLPRDIGPQLCNSVLNGSDVILSVADPREVEPGDRVTDRIEYGSLLNLPRKSSSIDAVVWVSRDLESDVAPFALREIFRVLKPGGQLVFATFGESPSLDLRRSLSAARIAFDHDQIPSAPVYSCCLHKDGGRGRDTPPRPSSTLSARNAETAHRHSAAVDPRLALLEDENARQIALVHDRFVQQEKVMDEARAVVDGAVQRAFGGDGWIWISSHFAEGYPTKFFMRGWRSALDWVVWSREDTCLLMLPFDEDQTSRGHRLELQLHLVLPQVSPSNPTTIGVRVNDGPIENFRLSSEDEILTVLSSTEGSKFRGVCLVEFQVGAEMSAGKNESLDGGVRMGVKRLRYRVFKSS